MNPPFPIESSGSSWTIPDRILGLRTINGTELDVEGVMRTESGDWLIETGQSHGDCVRLENVSEWIVGVESYVRAKKAIPYLEAALRVAGEADECASYEQAIELIRENDAQWTVPA
jgi:hypothetical protein